VQPSGAIGWWVDPVPATILYPANLQWSAARALGQPAVVPSLDITGAVVTCASIKRAALLLRATPPGWATCIRRLTIGQQLGTT
jgi:hypothetical protein